MLLPVQSDLQANTDKLVTENKERVSAVHSTSQQALQELAEARVQRRQRSDGQLQSLQSKLLWPEFWDLANSTFWSEQSSCVREPSVLIC